MGAVALLPALQAELGRDRRSGSPCARGAGGVVAPPTVLANLRRLALPALGADPPLTADLGVFSGLALGVVVAVLAHGGVKCRPCA